MKKPGYRRVRRPEHPRSDCDGKVYAHLIVAEAALGKFLPAGAEVHHVDGDKRNNVNGNLVICQDRRYHQFLHARARIVRAGGNPNTEQICCTCKVIKPHSAFNRSSANTGYGLQGRCRGCDHGNYMARLTGRDSAVPLS